MRSPRPVGDPLELTGATCIDMTYSGMGTNGFGTHLTNGFADAGSSLAIMFTPSGGAAGVYHDRVPLPTTGTIHLLLGRVAKMNQPDGVSPTHGRLEFEPEQSNLADATSLWVSVGRANGTVSTSENVPPAATSISLPNLTYIYTDEQGNNQTVTLDSNNLAHLAAYLQLSRRVAIGREQMGGQ
jgi:hypothetical protein